MEDSINIYTESNGSSNLSWISYKIQRCPTLFLFLMGILHIRLYHNFCVAGHKLPAIIQIVIMSLLLFHVLYILLLLINLIVLERFNYLFILFIEKDVTKLLSPEEVIKEYAVKSRRKTL